MMSPASVAQFLATKEDCFDLVIIDEASQMRPEEAIGALSRGKQAIVVGDPMQLPPTSFFDAVQDNAPNEDESAEEIDIDTESVLDQALSSWRPHRELNWHYRSKHHSLIAFSNKEFYGGRLVVFPSPVERSHRFGVEYVHVQDGVYSASVNPAEADAVIKRVKELIRSQPKSSIGVVAVNQMQGTC
jgi:superfamily I DNA and/or RNA helicase